MNHLQLPHNASFEPNERVPYLCANRQWDNQGFLTYAQRNATDNLAFLSDYDRLRSSWFRFQASDATVSLKKLEELYQCWFFFGLLREFLGDAFSPQSCIKNSKSEIRSNNPEELAYLDSSGLPSLFDTWVSTYTTHRELDSNTIEHLSKCLVFTAAALSITSMEKSGYDQFNGALRKSIASVCETIASAIYLVERDDSRFGVLMQQWHVFMKTEESQRIMRARGWCPYDIRKIFEMFTNFSTIYYFSKIVRSVEASYHGNCTEQHCARSIVNELTYDTTRKHVTPCSGCEERGIDVQKLEDCLSSGSYPIAAIKLDGQGEVESVDAVSSADCDFYVAISHVWADGLGNANRNALFSCQIKELGRLVKELRVQIKDRNERRDPLGHFETPCYLRIKQRGGPLTNHEVDCVKPFEQSAATLDSQCLYIWIDSLCCPARGSPGRKLALQRMRSSYLNAGAVLVLDKELQTVEASELDWLEQLARIIVSRWATRLWTLVEATYAADAWIQFGDRAIELYDVWVLQARSNPRSPHTFALRRILREELETVKLHESSQRFYTPLIEIDHASRNRIISHARDESFCLAVLLDLEVTDIINEPDTEKKMCLFWDQTSRKVGIPQTIIFHNAARLDIPGYRWALKAFSGSTKTSLAFHTDRGTITRKVDKGLPVNFPGFMFNAIAVLGNSVQFSDLADGSKLHVRLDAERWICVSNGDLGQPNRIPGDALLAFLLAHGPNCACITYADVSEQTRNAWSGTPCVLGYIQYDRQYPIFKTLFVCVVRNVGATEAKQLETGRQIVNDCADDEEVRSFIRTEEAGNWHRWVAKKELEHSRVCVKICFLKRAEEIVEHRRRLPGSRESKLSSQQRQGEAAALQVAAYKFFMGVRGEATSILSKEFQWLVD